MEAKQGVGGATPEDDTQLALLPDPPSATRKGHGTRGTRRWDDTMSRARNQADGYARAVSRHDGWPPFLMVVDVGHVIEIYADFSGQGQGYTQYPDGNRYRITLDDLRDPMDLGPKDTTAKDPWPKSLPEQIAAVRAALSDLGEATPEQVARQFQRGRAGTVQPLLESLTALGQARLTEGGRFAV
nr:type IIL restriction-modification enzyme MmeI [Roseovarius sp. BRH_c41]